jgi:hypothetical protein
MTKRLFAPAASLVMAAALLLGSAGCGSSHHSNKSTAGPHRTPASTINKIAGLCAQARQRVGMIPKPAAHNSLSPAAIGYDRRVVEVVDRMVANVTAAARSGQASSSLNDAIAVEDRGEKLVDAQIPALAHHQLGRVEHLAAQARALTAPADATLRQAGLGICVGP